MLLSAINPTVNFQVGDLAELPVPARGASQSLRDDVARLIELHRTLDRFDESTRDFVAPVPWDERDDVWQDATRRIANLQRRVDDEVAALYDVPQDNPATRGGDVESIDRCELARRWISFHFRRLIESAGGPVQNRPLDATVEQELRDACGGEIDDAAGGLRRFLENDFFAWHVKLYRRRPVVWVLGSRDRQFAVSGACATAKLLRPLMHLCEIDLPNGWERVVDDGVLVNLAPLCAAVHHRELRRDLLAVLRDLETGLLNWSETYQRMFIPGPKPARASPARVPRSRRSRLRAADAPPLAAARR
jgi:hypothetical protein